MRSGVLGLTYHDGSSLGVHGQVLPWNDATTATLSKRLLMNLRGGEGGREWRMRVKPHLLKEVLGRVVFQDGDPSRVRSDHDVV